MIDRGGRRGGPITISCDGRSASTSIATRTTELRGAIGVAKAAGWSARYMGEGPGWCHFCPTCTAAAVWESEPERIVARVAS